MFRVIADGTAEARKGRLDAVRGLANATFPASHSAKRKPGSGNTPGARFSFFSGTPRGGPKNVYFTILMVFFFR